MSEHLFARSSCRSLKADQREKLATSLEKPRGFHPGEADEDEAQDDDARGE